MFNPLRQHHQCRAKTIFIDKDTPLSPRLEREQGANSPPKVGENLGNLFAARSHATATIFNSINQASSTDQLDYFAKFIWRDYADGSINDDDAQFLQSCIDRRRSRGHASPNCHLKQADKATAKIAARLGSRFTPRQRPRSPDRQASRDRRRRLGGSSAVPDNLRHLYTEGQRAVLCIIAGEIKHHGICDLPIDKVAALAGVCRTTVQTTLHEARRLWHITITERPVRGQKHLTNVVRIAFLEWRGWIKRAPTAHRPIGSKTVNLVSTTKNTDLKARRIREGLASKGKGSDGADPTADTTFSD